MPEIPQSPVPLARRTALLRIAGLSALPVAMTLPSCSFRKSSPGVRYARELLRILDTIRKREEPAFRDAANLFAHTIIARNLCFLANDLPQLPGYLGEDTPGLPRVFVYLRSREMAETLRPGDAAFVTAPGELAGIARERGAKIVGMTSPLVLDDYTPEERDKLGPVTAIGELADIVIRTRLPFSDGLVTIPEYPFGVLPGSGPVELATVTALAGEVYRRTEKALRIESVGPRDATGFLETVSKRIRTAEKREKNFAEASALAAKKILNRGVLRVYDRQGALTRELARGAGTPAFVQPVTREQITGGTLRAIDALVFASLESDLPEDLHLIRMARGITNAIITISPKVEGGGYRIYNEALAGIDNLSPEKEGVRKFDNNARTYLHTGGILNVTLFWMLVGEIMGELIQAGDIPCCLMGNHLAGSAAYNANALRKAQLRGF